MTTPMSSSLGFGVFARRPGQPPEPVSAVFPAYPNGLEQAQNALEGCQTRKDARELYDRTLRRMVGDEEWEKTYRNRLDDAEPDPVVYVIGEIIERTP